MISISGSTIIGSTTNERGSTVIVAARGLGDSGFSVAARGPGDAGVSVAARGVGRAEGRGVGRGVERGDGRERACSAFAGAARGVGRGEGRGFGWGRGFGISGIDDRAAEAPIGAIPPQGRRSVLGRSLLALPSQRDRRALTRSSRYPRMANCCLPPAVII